MVEREERKRYVFGGVIGNVQGIIKKTGGLKTTVCGQMVA